MLQRRQGERLFQKKGRQRGVFHLAAQTRNGRLEQFSVVERQTFAHGRIDLEPRHLGGVGAAAQLHGLRRNECIEAMRGRPPARIALRPAPTPKLLEIGRDHAGLLAQLAQCAIEQRGIFIGVDEAARQCPFARKRLVAVGRSFHQQDLQCVVEHSEHRHIDSDQRAGKGQGRER
ncbi:hypothetical protein D3C85_1106660 [compost metagenome]